MTTVITKELLKELRPQIEAALNKVHPDLTFDLLNIKFSSTGFEGKIAARVNAPKGEHFFGGEKLSRAIKSYGIKDADKVKDGFKLVGYNSNKPKKCWVIVRVKDDREFICADGFLRQCGWRMDDDQFSIGSKDVGKLEDLLGNF